MIKKSERYHTARAHAEGAALRFVRKEIRLMSQTTLAERSGVAEGTIATIEIGHRQPSADVLSRLAEALDVPVSLIGHVYSRFETPCASCAGRGHHVADPVEAA